MSAVLVTPFGMERNRYGGLYSNVVTFDDLFAIGNSNPFRQADAGRTDGKDCKQSIFCLPIRILAAETESPRRILFSSRFHPSRQRNQGTI